MGGMGTCWNDTCTYEEISFAGENTPVWNRSPLLEMGHSHLYHRGKDLEPLPSNGRDVGEPKGQRLGRPMSQDPDLGRAAPETALEWDAEELDLSPPIVASEKAGYDDHYGAARQRLITGACTMEHRSRVYHLLYGYSSAREAC